MEHSNVDVASLGAKLDGLELTEGEQAILDAIFARDDETVGHSDSGFGLNIGGLIDIMSKPNPYYEGAGNHVTKDPISGTDLGSGRREP
jgi:hypothetical protein